MLAQLQEQDVNLTFVNQVYSQKDNPNITNNASDLKGTLIMQEGKNWSF